MAKLIDTNGLKAAIDKIKEMQGYVEMSETLLKKYIQSIPSDVEAHLYQGPALNGTFSLCSLVLTGSAQRQYYLTAGTVDGPQAGAAAYYYAGGKICCCFIVPLPTSQPTRYTAYYVHYD